MVTTVIFNPELILLIVCPFISYNVKIDPEIMDLLTLELEKGHAIDEIEVVYLEQENLITFETRFKKALASLIEVRDDFIKTINSI